MEKILVRSFEDLKKHCCRVEKNEDGNIYVFYPLQIEIRIDERTTHLKYAVDLLNKIFTDQNFEYKEVEVIDTLEKWEKFQEVLSKNNFFYDRTNEDFIELESNDEDVLIGVNDKNLDKTYIENKFNVDLKILK